MIKFLCFWLLVIPWALPAFSEEQSFPTIVALGAAWPLGSKEGQSTPLIILSHESNLNNFTTLLLGYRTVSPSASVSLIPEKWLKVEVGVDATFLTEGNATDLYDNGTRLENFFFRGNRTSAFVGVRLLTQIPWITSFKVGKSQYYFSAIEDQTMDGFRLPPSFSERFSEASIQKAGLLHKDGLAKIQIRQYKRLYWNNWEFDEDALENGSPVHNILEIEDHIEFDRTKWKGSLLHATGRGLDFFSAYKLGGLASDLVVAGYYRNEFRVRELNLLKFKQDVSFAEDRALSLFADFANFTEIELPFRTNSFSNHTIVGIGIGFRYGMRNLGGLPLIFTFGEGLNVPKASREAHRRECMLVIAAGF